MDFGSKNRLKLHFKTTLRAKRVKKRPYLAPYVFRERPGASPERPRTVPAGLESVPGAPRETPGASVERPGRLLGASGIAKSRPEAVLRSFRPDFESFAREFGVTFQRNWGSFFFLG